MLQRVLVCAVGLALIASVPAMGQIRVLEDDLEVAIDILPKRCPNRVDLFPELNPFSVTAARATNIGIPVAVIGSSTLDVRTIDPGSILLEGVAPRSHRYMDAVSAGIPLEGACDCFVSGPDGIEDLVLKFDRQDIIDALQPIDNGEERMVTLSLATKSGGVLMQAWDCIMVRTIPPSRYKAGITPQEPAAAFNYPNPFNAGTVISYEVGAEGHVRLEVFDVLGRTVATLVDETQTQGLYEEAWNGADSHGTPVGSGMYFFRLIQGQNVQTQKMVLLK